jgi:hypothetical protein
MTAGLRGVVLVSVVAFFAYAVLLQGIGSNQTSHFALVRALASGTTQIDPYHLQTEDLAYIKGHYYSNKAPGMALVATPAYFVLKHLGAVSAANRVTGTKSKGEVLMIWALTLLTAALPAAIVVLLTGLVALRLAPEAATLTAATVAFGTLIFPFGTMFFSHDLAAALLFGAFVLLWRESDRDRPARLIGLLAGVLAGFAATSEYPAILGTAVLGGYVLARRRTFRAVASYAAGAAIGLLPLAAYNLWAFGSLASLSYKNGVMGYARNGAAVVGGRSPHFFGIDLPSPSIASALLLSPKGLLTLTPVIGAGVFGLVLLYRRGLRSEAVTAAAIVLLDFLYVAGYYQPLGGWVPGPRYMIDCLPFLAFPLALVFRRLPLTTTVLAVGSTLAMLLATLTLPQLPSTAGPGVWFHLLKTRHFVKTIFSDAGAGRGIVGILPFLVLFVVACEVVRRTTSFRVVRTDALCALAAVLTWACIVRFGQTMPALVKTVEIGDAASGAALLLASGLLFAAVIRRGPRGLSGAVLLVPVLAPGAGTSASVVGALALASALVSAVLLLRQDRATPASAAATP